LNTSAIRTAIAKKQLVEFVYRGYPRVAEPHVYGIKDGKRQLLVYQVGGLASSGKIEAWHRINLEEISGFKVAESQFAVRRNDRTSDYNDWDTVIAAVE
jgi:hypothetical protein